MRLSLTSYLWGLSGAAIAAAAFRPGRSAHQALTVMEESWKEGRRHAVECDLKSLLMTAPAVTLRAAYGSLSRSARLDTVNHDRLMNALKEKVRCRRALGLIRRYLTAGVELPDGTREATPQGVPQGGPLSPLLANITLDPLDSRSEAETASPQGCPEGGRSPATSWKRADTSSRDTLTSCRMDLVRKMCGCLASLGSSSW